MQVELIYKKVQILIVHMRRYGRQIFGFLLSIGILFGVNLSAHSQIAGEKPAIHPPASWISNGTLKLRGVGVADYTRFDKEGSWNKAIRKAVVDLNANIRILVHSYGYQIGRGPMRYRQKFGINSVFDTTDVVPTDSVIWKDWAFVRVKSKHPIPDSVLQKISTYEPVSDTLIQDALGSRGEKDKWVSSTGSSDRLRSNLHKSITKAKQDALRRLAEDITIKVNTSTHYQADRSHSDYQYSTTFGFQNVRVINRKFKKDTVMVTVALRSHDVISLVED